MITVGRRTRLDYIDFDVIQAGVDLLPYERCRDVMSITDALSILRGQRGRGRQRIAFVCSDGLLVCLKAAVNQSVRWHV